MPEQVRSGGRWVVCQNCGRSQTPGLVRCSGCGTCLRPGGLGLFAVAGILVCIGAGVTIIGGMLGWKMCAGAAGAWAIPLLIALVALGFIVFHLGHGRWWAWAAVQGLVALNLAAAPFLFVWLSSTTAMPPCVAQPLLLVEAALAVGFWYYLRTARVRAFYGRKRGE